MLQKDEENELLRLYEDEIKKETKDLIRQQKREEVNREALERKRSNPVKDFIAIIRKFMDTNTKRRARNM